MGHAAEGVDDGAPPRWLQTAVRWGMVNFDEHDPGTIDLDAWQDLWRRCRLQAACIASGGPIAFYPSALPHHRRSRYLDGGRDLFGDALAAARSLGMRVLARLDPGVANDELFAAHPDWIVTTRDGEPRSIPTMGPDPLHPGVLLPERAYTTCVNGPYFSEYVPAMMQELLDGYDIDGFFTNAYPWLGIAPPTADTVCHCPHCRRAWAAAAPGRPLPSAADPDDPDWRNYVGFMQERVEGVQTRFRDLVRRHSHEASFVSTAYPAAATALRWDRWVHLVDALGSDGQGRRNPLQPGRPDPALWEVGFAAEQLRAVGDGKPVLRFIAGYLFQQYRHAARPPLELALELVLSVAHGEHPQWHVLGGTQRDRRWMPVAEDVDRWLASIEPLLEDRTSTADVALLWSSRAVHLGRWATAERPDHGEALLGWYEALLRARIPIDLVHEDALHRLDEHRVVVLPTGLVLDDAGVAALAAYRSRGGRVVVAGDALLADRWGAPRDFADRAGLTGVPVAGGLIGPLEQAYVGLEPPLPFLAAGDTDVLAGGRWWQPLEPVEGAAGAFHEDSPMHPTHAAILPAARPDLPAAVVADGAVVLAADLDAQYHRLSIPDHAAVLAGAVLAALDGTASVRVEGAGLLDVRRWDTADSLLVFLVHLDHPGAVAPFADALRPLGEQVVRLRLDGRRPTAVACRRSGAVPEWYVEGDEVVVPVPFVGPFELLVVDTEPA